MIASLPASQPGPGGTDCTEADLSGSQMDSDHGPVWFLSLSLSCALSHPGLFQLCASYSQMIANPELGGAGHPLLEDD